MTVTPGTLTCTRRGQLDAQIFDSPYTVTPQFSLNSATANGFAYFSGCQLWPTLSSCYIDVKNFYSSPPFPYGLADRFNAAICQPTYDTLQLAGNQGALITPGCNTLGNITPSTMPAYYGGYLGYAWLNDGTANLTFMAQECPLGIGSTAIPAQEIYTMSDWRSSQGTYSRTYVMRYQGWRFCMLGSNGAQSNFKVFAWSPNLGFTILQDTNGPYISDFGNPARDNIAISPCYSSLAANTILGYPQNYSPQVFTLWYMDGLFQCKFAFKINFDNPAINTLLQTNGYGVKVVPQGYLIIIYAANSIFGYQQPVCMILMSADGTSYVPISFNLSGPNGKAWLANLYSIGYPGLLRYTWDFTIDQFGIGYFYGWIDSAGTLPVYNGSTFKAMINFPPLSGVTPNLPPFTLPCFTPCDIQTIYQ